MSDVGGVIDSAKTGLQGKIGPVPVWAVAGGLGVLAVGGYYVYSRKAGAAVDTATAAPTATVSDGSYATTGNSGNVDNADTATAVGSTTATNAGWIATSSLAVSQNISASPFLVSAALIRYVSGASITPTEKTYVDAAIAAKGYPPEGLNGVSDVVDPVAVAAQASAQAASDQAASDARDRAAADQETARQVALVNAQAQADQAAANRDSSNAAALSAAQSAATAAADAAQRAADAATKAKAATPVQTVNKWTISNVPIGQKFRTTGPYKAYAWAKDANVRRSQVTSLPPGTYTVNDRQKLSNGYVVKLNGYWVNI